MTVAAANTPIAETQADTEAGTEALAARTPLYALHREMGARMVVFAGTEMPLHYRAGMIDEHLATRAGASLFDVSHMGQAVLSGAPFDKLAAAFETMVCGDIAGLAPGAARYTMLLNEAGGVRDDLIAMRGTRDGAAGSDALILVVNASLKAADFAHIENQLPALRLDRRDDLALLALQGPLAATVLKRVLGAAGEGPAGLAFMRYADIEDRGERLSVSRTGYTGEDGFEISLRGAAAPDLARRLMADPDCAPAGLGARDSLRLEAGLCLMGRDLDETTSPVEAGLGWAVAKRRRAAADFPGAARILDELKNGPARARVGLRPGGRSIARAGDIISDIDANEIGLVTSGAWAPTVGGPIAMGYISGAERARGTELLLAGRKAPRPAEIVGLPFVATRYFNG